MKVGIIGHFMFQGNQCNGQAIKTLNYYDELKSHYGPENVYYLDTLNIQKKLFRNLLLILRMGICCEAIIIMPTKALLYRIVLLLNFLRKIFKFKLVYVVVGGWLPETVENSPKLRKELQQLDTVLVETHAMVRQLQLNGISNAIFSPNFTTKKMPENIQTHEEISYPYSYCTFSRVTKSKGILDAINAISSVNRKAGEIVCRLDIWGPIDSEFKEELLCVLEQANGEATYCGILDSDNTIDILSEYYAMLFPTKYEGEGFPGAVVEAMCAGTPVIASDWKYNSEVIRDGVTGFLYPVCETEKLEQLIEYLNGNREIRKNMRENCIAYSKEYSAQKVMQILYDQLESN